MVSVTHRGLLHAIQLSDSLSVVSELTTLDELLNVYREVDSITGPIVSAAVARQTFPLPFSKPDFFLCAR